MKQIEEYNIDFSSTSLDIQVQEFFQYYDMPQIAVHSFEVANEAKKIAEIYKVSTKKAYIAGLLHDISAVIPNSERIEIHKKLGEQIYPEEKQLPMLLHQRQSVWIAKEFFYVKDCDVLCAIGCHTTLKKNASELDKVVYLADKIKWDRGYTPPYLNELTVNLKESLDAACRVYIKWALSDVIVLHPYLKDAINDLRLTE
ncbi:bis(5'-nucleosyl)-tetraphosphatase (symmetrical) YqeK [Enterococcus faecalis]|uniref:bis(5'-nucleosyl)-tetraphosphatase (symmetrical) YqeK n=1 Tax=Enterococcus faecalis TaxID=1351 RepID=UPI003CC54944